MLNNFCASVITKSLSYICEFCIDNTEYSLWILEDILTFFDKCLNMDYTYMLAYREKGIALYDQEKYTDAVTVLDKAVTLQNNFDEGYYWLGRCLEKLNKPTDAIEEYKMAVLYAPDYIEARAALERLQHNK